jgi:hypothetical protein
MFASLEGFLNSTGADWQKFNTLISTPPAVAAIQPPPDNLNNLAVGVSTGSSIDIITVAEANAGQSAQLDKMNSDCIAASQPQELIDMGIQGNFQCGWYYNSTKRVGQGYLSDKNGPLPGLTAPVPQSPYKFYFDTDNTARSLQAAQETYDTDRCGQLKTCTDLPNYKGCGYCTSSLKGIPVNPDNSVKYPDNIMARCIQTNIVTNKNQCPAPPPPSTASATSSSGASYPRIPDAGNCQAEANGRLSGACLQNALFTSGCQSKGALHMALGGFTSTTNPDSLRQNNKTIGTYVDLNPKFNLQQFLMAGTMKDAQAQAAALSKDSKTAEQNAKNNKYNQTKDNTLAIDMCKQSGYFLDQYDFCTELQPTTPVPTVGWDITCLQKALLKAFKIPPNPDPTVPPAPPPSGNMYPKNQNDCAHRYYNTLSPWSAVTDHMASIYDNMYNGGPKYTNPCGPNPEPVVGPPFMSKPFSLQSLNFPERMLRWNSDKGRPMIVNWYDSDCNYTWQPSPTIPNAIQFIPVNWNTSRLYYRDWILRARPVGSDADYLASYYVRTGNAGSDTVSFESTAHPGYFLRHAGYVMWMHRKDGSALFNQDSSFWIRGGAKEGDAFTGYRPKSFFTIKETAEVKNYPGQHGSVNQGLGVLLDPAQIIKTEGFQSEYKQGIELFAFQPIHGIHTITTHAIVPSLQTVHVGGLSQVYTLANYVSSQDQTLVVTSRVNAGNTLESALNSYIGLKQSDLTRFPVSSRGPNRVKTLWKSNGKAGSEFSYVVKPTGTAGVGVYAPLSPHEPFLRFEPFSDPVWTGNKYIFTEVRMPEIANVQLGGALPEFHTKGITLLKSPGSHGHVHLSGSQFNIPYVDLTLCDKATFCFSVAQIPPSTAAKPSTVLRLCNRTDEAMVNGYTCVVYGSTNSSMSFAVQTPGKSTTPVTVTVDKWYLLTLTKELLQLSLLDTNTNLTTVVTTIPLNGTTPIQKTTSRIGPLIQIGDASTSLRLNVAWLHLYC